MITVYKPILFIAHANATILKREVVDGGEKRDVEIKSIVFIE